MKRGLALLFLGFTAMAAFAGDRRGPSDGWYGSEDYRYGRDGVQNRGRRGGYAYARSDVVARAIQNLRYAAARSRVDSHERNHFQRAIYHLQRFDSDYARGDFDNGHLNDAMAHMHDLARAHQVHPRDRQLIARDLSALRALRSGGRARW